MLRKIKNRFLILAKNTFQILELILLFAQNNLTNRQFVYISSVLVAVSSALAVIVLKTFAHTVFNFANYIDSIFHLPYSNSILPIVGILLTVLVIQKFLDGSIQKGTAQIMIAIANKSGFIPQKQMYAQILTSSLTVGLGGSAGLESPITITGAAFGSNYAKHYKFSYKDRVLLLACGVAAGIAAAFNAPIAGVLFAIEVVLADMSISAFIPLMIASATGALTSNIILKEDILLHFTEKLTFNSANIPYYVAIGVIAGFVSVYHARMFRKIENYCAKLGYGPYKKALIGASFLALLIFLFPTLFGEGYESIKALSSSNPEEILNNTLLENFKSNQWILLFFVAITLLIKSIATALTLGSGGNGGNFAPSLFVGSYLGFVVAKFFSLIGLSSNLPISNFTIVGMAGVLSGLFHAPLTAIFLIAEITSGYNLMIPLLIVSSISFAISKKMEGYSMDIKTLVKKGIVFTSDKDKNLLSSIEIKSHIVTNFVSINITDTLETVIKKIENSTQLDFPVVDLNQNFIGIAEFKVLKHYIFNPDKIKNTNLKDLVNYDPVVITAYDTIETIMSKFTESGMYKLFYITEDQCLGYVKKIKILESYREKLNSLRIE
nr:chloride channel protein [uncultured Flavobacterium sp.]